MKGDINTRHQKGTNVTNIDDNRTKYKPKHYKFYLLLKEVTNFLRAAKTPAAACFLQDFMNLAKAAA
jgi:hypothetical protein